MNRGTDSFKGNKRYLPTKPCATARHSPRDDRLSRAPPQLIIRLRYS
jgi:hypothetical protein